MSDVLPFPDFGPDDYLVLNDEPIFDPKRHLDLGQPEQVVDLGFLGYSKDEIEKSPSNFGMSSVFKILSDEGLQIMRTLCRKMHSNRNASAGTGQNRLGSYIRGAGYRSKFIRDFCDCVELADHVSAIAKVPLVRHSVPAVACGINFAPEDIEKAVDTWHVDSVAFDIVMMLSDPAIIEGGEFQAFLGTKYHGQNILGISGEEGRDVDLPEEKVRTITFPAAGYGFLQQGNMIFHRAKRLLKRAERITMIPSFVVNPASAVDATNSKNMAGWDDPGIVPELARHELWRASARLKSLAMQISVNDETETLVDGIDDALQSLHSFKNHIGNK